MSPAQATDLGPRHDTIIIISFRLFFHIYFNWDHPSLSYRVTFTIFRILFFGDDRKAAVHRWRWRWLAGWLARKTERKKGNGQMFNHHFGCEKASCEDESTSAMSVANAYAPSIPMTYSITCFGVLWVCALINAYQRRSTEHLFRNETFTASRADLSQSTMKLLLGPSPVLHRGFYFFSPFERRIPPNGSFIFQFRV